MKRYILLLLSLLFVMSCQDKRDGNTAPDPESIFNLTSKWETQDGNKIRLEELKGRTLVMVMVYSSCRTACPRLVADMRNIEKEVGEKNPNKINYVLVSIDPKTDTPARMKEFMKENKLDDKHWIFLRGSEADTQQLANVLAVKYKQISPMDFSHSNIISVFNRGGVLQYQKEGSGIDISSAVAETKKALHN